MLKAGQVELLEQRLNLRMFNRHPRQSLRKQHVAPHGQGRQQVETLKHQTDVLSAESVQFRPTQCGEILTENPNDTGTGPDQPGQQMEKRRLPAAGGTDHGHAIATG